MICVVCRQHQLTHGFVSIVFDRDKTKLFINSIPAIVCRGCGETFVNSITTTRLLELAENAAELGLSGVTYDYGEIDLLMK